MQTLEIKVPDSKTRQVKEFLKELGVTVKVKKEKDIPNADTIAAMNELKAGKGKKFKNIDALFNSILCFMFEIVTSTKFLRDLKLLKKRSAEDLKLLQQLITVLADNGHKGLSKKHKPHKLSGSYKGY